MAEDSYLNWQLCCAWFCYKRNISFIQALCTNLQLGNMNLFIHCVLAISNHPDSNLKSWTGEVGSGSSLLPSDLCCPGTATAWSSWGAAWRYGSTQNSLSTSHTRCQDKSYSVFLRAAPSSWWAAGWVMQHLKDGWDHQGQWPDPGGTSSRRTEASRFMDVWNGTSSSSASRMACKVFSFSFPYLRDKSYQNSKKVHN